MTTKQICLIWDLAVPEYPVSLLSQKSRKDAIVRHRRAFMQVCLNYDCNPLTIGAVLNQDRTSILYLRDTFKVDSEQVELQSKCWNAFVAAAERLQSPINALNDWAADAKLAISGLDLFIENLQGRRAQIQMMLNDYPF